MDEQDSPPDEVDETFEPEHVRVLADLDEVRALAHPLRQSILDCVIPAELTVKEIGRQIGIGSTKLYYHIAALERVGLVRATRNEIKGGVCPKRYRATARYYQIAAGLLRPTGNGARLDAGADFVAGAVEHSARLLREAFAVGVVDRWADVVVAGRRTSRVSPEQAAAFRDRLAELVREFVAIDDGDEELRMEMAYALFPRAESAHRSVREGSAEEWQGGR